MKKNREYPILTKLKLKKLGEKFEKSKKFKKSQF